MNAIKKNVSDWTCGFEQSYSVSEIELTFDKNIVNQISLAWKYLEDKDNQSIRITCKLEEVNFKSDDYEFDENIYSIFVRVHNDRTIIIECRDKCCLMCYSSIIEENELILNSNL